MAFNGKYQRLSHQNLEELLNYVQMNDSELRKQALDSFPFVEVILFQSKNWIVLIKLRTIVCSREQPHKPQLYSELNTALSLFKA